MTSNSLPLLWILAFLAGLTCACRSTGASSQPSPADVEWTLVELNGEAAPADLSATLTLISAERRATGSTGLNQFNGAYDLKDGELSLGPFATTRKAGPPEAMELEAQLLQSFSACDGLRVVEGRLELSQGEDVLSRWAQR